MLGSAVIPALGITGTAVGWMAGSMVGSLLFPPKMADGPRLSDLSVQTSAYGQPVPLVYGTARLAGNVIWATPLNEHEIEHGKGGGYSTYDYTVSMAVAFCEGPVTGIRRIWAGGKLIYDIGASNDGHQKDFAASAFVVYTGGETQTVDPTIQAYETDAPAYRGLCYVVFTDLALGKFGNAIPPLTAEIVNGTYALPAPAWVAQAPYGANVSTRSVVVDPNTGYLWSGGDDDGVAMVDDPITHARIASIPLGVGVPGGAGWGGGSHLGSPKPVYCPLTDTWWFGELAPGSNHIWIVSAVTMTLIDIVSMSGQFPVLWNSSLGHMVCTKQNALDSGIWTVDPVRYVTAEVQSGIGPSAFVAIEIPDWNIVAVSRGAGLYIMHAESYVIRASWTDGPGIGEVTTGNNEHLSYDPVRGLLLWRKSSTVVKMVNLFDLSASDWTTGYTNINIHYHAGTDSYLILDGIAGGSRLRMIDPDTHALIDTYGTGVGGGYSFIQTVTDVPGFEDRIYARDGDGSLIIYLSERVAPSDIALSTIVTDISSRVGLTGSDVDVSSLADNVHGFIVSRQGTARSQIEQLMMAFSFDAVESGGVVKFVKRGSASATVIDADDLSAHDPGSDTPAPLHLTRSDEVELPREITIRYSNRGADYETGAQYARRLTGRAEAETMTELPIVLDDSEARAIADAALYSAWVARTSAEFSTGLKHARVEPTDVVSIDGNLIRVTSRSVEGNRISFTGSMDDGTVFLGASVAAESPAPASSSTVLGPPSNTILYLMDIPTLRDQDSTNAFYIAAAGAGNQTWPGCVVYVSWDAGASWTELITLTNPVKAGACSDALAGYAGGSLFDNTSSVTVVLRNSADTLTSTTEANVQMGRNACLIGGEILGFTTATLVSAGIYTLTGLLRYQRGTTSAATHVAGDRFVLLEESTVRRVEQTSAQVGIPALYKAVTFGAEVTAATQITFTNTANGGDPNFYAVVSRLHFDGADASTTFNDVKGKTWTAAGNAKISTAQSMFGGASGLFDGTGDWISTPTHNDFNFGTGDFTVSFFMRAVSASNNYGSIFANAPATYTTNARYIMFHGSATSQPLKVGLGGNGPGLVVVTPSSLTLDVWTHIEVGRHGNTFFLFQDGALVATGSSTASFNFSNTATRIGANGWDGTAGCFNGYIDEFDAVRGVCRHTSSFTVPASAYPDY